jgi:hypothetical protein
MWKKPDGHPLFVDSFVCGFGVFHLGWALVGREPRAI